MKAKLIGIGAAGNKAAIKAIELGVFDKASVRIMNTTVKDINHDYDDISVIFGNQRGGCGKERNLAKKLMKNALKQKLIGLESFLEEDDDTVVIVSSSEGGTGCGASTILAKYIDSVLAKNVHLFVFTGFEQDARGLQNTLEYFKDLEDTFTVESISNKKFLDSSKNKAEAEEKANEEFAKRMRVFLGMDLRESDQNIDGTDLFKLSTTPGFMDVEKQVLQGIKNTTDLSNTIREMFDYSKSLEYTKTAKRIGIILNVSERTKEIDVDPTAVFKYTGEPFEVYYHIQTVNPGEDEYIAVIAAGLKLPTEELKTVYNEYLQRTNNIDKSQDEFLDEIGSLETVSEDKMFNLRKKKKAQSAEDFFGDDDEEDDEISTIAVKPSQQEEVDESEDEEDSNESVLVVKHTKKSQNPFKDELEVRR